MHHVQYVKSNLKNYTQSLTYSTLLILTYFGGQLIYTVVKIEEKHFARHICDLAKKELITRK